VGRPVPAPGEPATAVGGRAEPVPAPPAPGGGVMAAWPRYLLLLEVRPPALREGMGPPAPAILRLRAALKQLRRCFGVACISIEQERGQARPAGGGPAGGAREGGPGGA